MVSYGPAPPTHWIAGLAAVAAVFVLQWRWKLRSNWATVLLSAAAAFASALAIGVFINEWFWDAGACTYDDATQNWEGCGYTERFDVALYGLLLIGLGAGMTSALQLGMRWLPRAWPIVVAAAPLAMFPVMLLTDPDQGNHPLLPLWIAAVVVGLQAWPEAADRIVARIRIRQNASH